MTNYREILRLSSLGLNKTQIAQSVGCSRTTVIQVLNIAEEKGISYPLPPDLSDRRLSELLFPSTKAQPKYKMPDYEYVGKELQKSGVTFNLLWLEYCEQCRNNGELPYQLTQFKKHYRDYAAKTNATMHLNHKPGEILQVDWAGDTAKVVNTDTGELMPAYVFVASLPYSGYAYVEAFFSMNEECWISAHVNAFKYFGGVTRIIQCDNLKTGVTVHRKSEVILNKTYNDMAEHYGTAILPCRVERLYLFNHKPFQKRDGSRASEFEEEKKFLLPLPQRPFELSEWKVATVAPNYHISVDRMNYSVPYEYIKQKVDVRLTKSTVEVFFNGNRICSHPRLHGRPNQYSTTEEHMPPNHQKYVQWNGDRFRRWASKIGESTHTVIDALLSGYKVEQQGYKACMGILKLADKYSPERLENACRKALSYTPRPSLKNIQTILASGQDKISDEKREAEKKPESQYGFTRGADYYEGRMK